MGIDPVAHIDMAFRALDDAIEEMVDFALERIVADR